MKKIILTIFLSLLIYCNGHSQWLIQTTGTTNPITSINAVRNSSVLVAVGMNGLVLRTSNSGDNWIICESITNKDLYAVMMKDSVTGFAGGDSSALIKTTNSGVNWASVNYGGLPDEKVTGISGFTSNTLYVVTDKGNFYRSTNSGNSFGASTNLNETLNTIYSLGPGFTLVGGDSGRVLKSTNDGQNWIDVSILTGEPVKEIKFINILTGYCITSTNVYKTTNGGINWANKVSLPPLITSMYLDRFSNADTVYITGVAGRIIKTVNGGSNWVLQASGVGDFLSCVSGINNMNIWVCGSSGKILKTTNGGGNFILSAVETISESPVKYSLKQNYPNPFNPETKINFDIPSPGYTKLVVYDVLGKEAAILLSGNLSAGRYSVSFNASGLPGGVYFYRLSTGDYNDVKKMVLVK